MADVFTRAGVGGFLHLRATHMDAVARFGPEAVFKEPSNCRFLEGF
jgi:hypothetical protein